MKETCELLKKKSISAQFSLVGSEARKLKDTIRNALNKAVGGKSFSDAQDSTSCLTALLHFKDTPNVEFSFDVAIIKKNPNGNYMG